MSRAQRPLVVITNQRRGNPPDAFLRRCLVLPLTPARRARRADRDAWSLVGGRTSRLIDAAMPSFSARRSYSRRRSRASAQPRPVPAGSGLSTSTSSEPSARGNERKSAACPDGARGQVRLAEASQRVRTVTRTRTASRLRSRQPTRGRGSGAPIWFACFQRCQPKIEAAAAQLGFDPPQPKAAARTCRSAGSATCRPPVPTPQTEDAARPLFLLEG